MKWTAIAAIVTGMTLSMGCSSTLETGYEPRRLGASASERRAFYAESFTPEANTRKEAPRHDPYQSRRPGQY
jgi:hypothetical protein